MGRTLLDTNPNYLVVGADERVHLQLRSGTNSLNTLWIQDQGTLFVYARRYIDVPSILRLATLLIDTGGFLHVIPGNSILEPISFQMSQNSLFLLPLPSDLPFLMEILGKEEEIYKITHSATTTKKSTIVLSARGLLNDSVREAVFGN